MWRVVGVQGWTSGRRRVTAGGCDRCSRALVVGCFICSRSAHDGTRRVPAQRRYSYMLVTIMVSLSEAHDAVINGRRCIGCHCRLMSPRSGGREKPVDKKQPFLFSSPRRICPVLLLHTSRLSLLILPLVSEL